MKIKPPSFFSRLASVILVLLLANQAAALDSERSQNSNQELPLSELRIFAQVLDHIRTNYVEPVTDQELLENAIRGMLYNLDPHSDYLDQTDFEELQINTTGEFGGIGIEVGMEDGYIKIISPIDDTPASRAGIRAGDIIIKLDGESIKGLNLGQAVEKMRGPIGTDVVVTILREGESEPLDFTLTRDRIQIRSVKHSTLQPGIGYLRITQFQTNTGEDVLKAIQQLKKSNSPLNGLIMDLRNNPGGVLNGAVAVSDLFLEQGRIVYTQGRMQDSHMEFEATAGDVLQGKPLIVLVNGGSASASEIVAGALQDNQRAVIIGEKTFGKGSVQTVLPLGNKKALKLTTARYYTPSGRSIQALGIEPDILVPRAHLTDIHTDDTFKEADLKGHLENSKAGKSMPSHENITQLAEEDYQLYEALNLLKGITLANRLNQAPPAKPANNAND